MLELAKEFDKTDPAEKMAIIVDAFKKKEDHSYDIMKLTSVAPGLVKLLKNKFSLSDLEVLCFLFIRLAEEQHRRSLFGWPRTIAARVTPRFILSTHSYTNPYVSSGIQSSGYLKMSGNEDHHRQGRRFAAGGNGHDGRDPRDVEIERLRQRVRELEIQHEIRQIRKRIRELELQRELTKETESEPIIWDIGDEEEEYPFVNNYPSLQEPSMLVKEESCPVYDTDNEEKSEIIYETYGNDVDDSLKFELLHTDPSFDSYPRSFEPIYPNFFSKDEPRFDEDKVDIDEGERLFLEQALRWIPESVPMARNDGSIFTFDDIERNEGEKGLVEG
nr:reverse transcriptase domain-containing protein [Tanacetum cinerariifolium]